jgi:hypothetical protein
MCVLLCHCIAWVCVCANDNNHIYFIFLLVSFSNCNNRSDMVIHTDITSIVYYIIVFN